MSTKNKSCTKGGKLARYLKAPLKMLCLANNFYAKALTDWSDQGYGAALGSPAGGPIYALPLSFNAGSSTTSNSNLDEDYRELVRVASIGNPSAKNNVEFRRPAGERMPRARSVGVGIRRIDEDKPCDFEDDSKVNKGVDLLRRSKSSAPFRRASSRLF